MDITTVAKQMFAALSMAVGLLLVPLDTQAEIPVPVPNPSNPPVFDTPIPIVVYNPHWISFGAEHPVCNATICPSPFVNTGPLFNAASVTHYMINAKTTLYNGVGSWFSQFGTCQLYAKISGKVLIIDEYIQQPVLSGEAQTVVLQGALCPETSNPPDDVGVTCTTANLNSFGYKLSAVRTVLSLIPFASDVSPIENRSSGGSSPLSHCSPLAKDFQ